MQREREKRKTKTANSNSKVRMKAYYCHNHRHDGQLKTVSPKNHLKSNETKRQTNTQIEKRARKSCEVYTSFFPTFHTNTHRRGDHVL